MSEENFLCEFNGCRKAFSHMQCHRHIEKVHPEFIEQKRNKKQIPLKETNDHKFICILSKN